MDGNLAYGAEFILTHQSATGAPGATDTTGAEIVDMTGYDACCFIGIADSLTAAGDAGIELYQADSSESTSFIQADTDYAGAYKITTTTGNDASLFVLDVNKPRHKWLSARVHKATQASSMTVVAIKYKPHVLPVVNTTDNYRVSALTLVNTPTSSM